MMYSSPEFESEEARLNLSKMASDGYQGTKPVAMADGSMQVGASNMNRRYSKHGRYQ